MDLVTGIVRIERSVDHAGRLGLTKTRRGRVVELSTRLREVLTSAKPDLCADEALVFPSKAGGLMLSGNFRSRVFRRLVRRAFGPGRSLTPHVLRHTWASLHLARGTNLKWVQEAGGWASAKMLLDVYGHFMPTETRGFADAITTPNGPQTAPTTLPDTEKGRVPGRNIVYKKGKTGADGRTRTADLLITNQQVVFAAGARDLPL